jgi:hypothetical protein
MRLAMVYLRATEIKKSAEIKSILTRGAVVKINLIFVQKPSKH